MSVAVSVGACECEIARMNHRPTEARDAVCLLGTLAKRRRLFCNGLTLRCLVTESLRNAQTVQKNMLSWPNRILAK